MNLKNIFTLALIFLIASCTSNSSDKEFDDSIAPVTLPAPQPITFSVDAVYPHDNKAFIQGLEFHWSGR